MTSDKLSDQGAWPPDRGSVSSIGGCVRRKWSFAWFDFFRSVLFDLDFCCSILYALFLLGFSLLPGWLYLPEAMGGVPRSHVTSPPGTASASESDNSVNSDFLRLNIRAMSRPRLR